MGNIRLKLFPFQEKAALKLIDLTAALDSKQVIVMKAPTGSGKTIILLDYIDEYLYRVDSNIAFIWFCPGAGGLEEQSQDKMRKLMPNRKTQNIFDAMQNGFEAETTTFINWELVRNKDKNLAIRDGERKNLFDRIADAHRNGIKFIAIIDEEHANDTKKAQDIIDAFSTVHTIRVSATANPNKKCEFFEIDELEVINAGLITKAIYVNEGVEDNVEITTDYDYLLELANAKRIEIQNRYKTLDGTKNANIRPLVLIQFPNGQPETIFAVENKLANMGYTYENGMVAKWMADEKKNLNEDFTHNDGVPIFLLMKQAVSTGWDCPRAKILVKLREGMSEEFEVQTIGRIRRMPEAVHYNDDLLDFCYVYTFDEKYKTGLLTDMDKAYETRRLFLKDKCRSFTLEKQVRDIDFDGLGDRDILALIHEHLVFKYKLSDDKAQNKKLLQSVGYVFGNNIINQVLYGQFVRTTDPTDKANLNSTNYHTTLQKADTHKHGLQFLHSMDSIKSAVGIPTAKVRIILERLFRDGTKPRFKLVKLSTEEFYAFVINNAEKLRWEFKEVTANMTLQLEMVRKPKTSAFHIPEQDFFRYDSGVKSEREYDKNAYREYTSGFATSLVRSTSEMLFEQFCEKKDSVDWVYKNGDTGQQYFSIVYTDGIRHQWLFYVDYIVTMKDGTVWIIETKGGESQGKDKNIDIQIANKFNALKAYAEKFNLHWGFVRDKDNQLYINNTDFKMDMADPEWKPLDDIM
ncbi:MAG: DEAD/DEAH box helicase family protein [Lachnospiraceae bacterium]|nr:DEAD/DEAH box helicase family protein [Lachnospiraceae bacterium]